MARRLFTSESVTEGHPDKICDQISDAIVTDCLRHDKNSRVAAECLIKDYEIIIAGEITSAHRPDFKALARGVLRRIGLPGVDQYRVTALISQQSPDIALGVDADGAGDQGMMFGYATDLRSKTQGRGQYSMEPDEYKEVPKSIAEQIISNSAKKDD